MKDLRTPNLTFVSLVVLALPIGAALAADAGNEGPTQVAPVHSDRDPRGASPPPVTGQVEPTEYSKAIRGTAEQPPPSTVGRSIQGPDGVSTKIVKPEPCGVAAHGTDGTTTCIGIPSTR